MGTSISSYPKYEAAVTTKEGSTFRISYHVLAEHILLLRKVIKNPEMGKEGPMLHACIYDYCQKMARNEMKTAEQQSELPWQIEWIWHVHRLHPINYRDDCEKQLSSGLVDRVNPKAFKNFNKKYKPNTARSLVKNEREFAPSIDLVSAVVRQTQFLTQFKSNFLYQADLSLYGSNQLIFQNLVQKYIWFLKLAKEERLIVPTFEIDIMWHTHMRCPSHYHAVSKGLCGFILDHDDAIESYVLNDGFQKTAALWKTAYQSEYAECICRKNIKELRTAGACGTVVVPAISPPCSSCGGGSGGGCNYGGSSGGGVSYSSRCGGGGCHSSSGGGGGCYSSGGGGCSDSD